MQLPDVARMLGANPTILVYVKNESVQPGLSIKSRVAYAMVRQALVSGRRIVESSSGNLAIGLAYWTAVLDADPPRCLVDACCEEPVLTLLDSLDAEIEVVPLSKQERRHQLGVLPRIRRARELQEEGFYWPDQYNNAQWIGVHAASTGPEIWRDFRSFDLVACGVGTGATISGVSNTQPVRSTTRIVAVEPLGSAVFGGAAGPYVTAGVGNPFTPGNYRSSRVDHEIVVADDETLPAVRTLRELGLQIGSSGTMTLLGGLRCARPGDRLLFVQADDGWYEYDE